MRANRRGDWKAVGAYKGNKRVDMKMASPKMRKRGENGKVWIWSLMFLSINWWDFDWEREKKSLKERTDPEKGKTSSSLDLWAQNPRIEWEDSWISTV